MKDLVPDQQVLDQHGYFGSTATQVVCIGLNVLDSGAVTRPHLLASTQCGEPAFTRHINHQRPPLKHVFGLLGGPRGLGARPQARDQ